MCKIIDFEDQMRKRNTIVIVTSDGFPKPEQTQFVDLQKGITNEPAVVIGANIRGKLQEYILHLVTGYQIVACNKFLKSLNLKLEIKFESYRQYADLLFDCTVELDKRNTANGTLVF